MLSGLTGLISKGTAGGGSEAVIGSFNGWAVNLNGQSAEVRCSGAKGGVIRLPAGKDWSGRYGATGPTPAVWPGDLFRFNGSIAGVNGPGASGDVMIDSVNLDWQCENGGDISQEVAFSGDGEMSLDAATVTPDDDTIPAPVSATGCTLQLAPAAAPLVYATVADVRSMGLSFSRANQSGRSSSSSPWPKRAKGHLDGRLTASIYAQAATGWSALPTVHTFYAAKIGAGGATFWLVKWLELLEITDLMVDQKTGAFAGGTLNFAFSGFTPIAGTWTEGVITDPANVTRWPV